MQLNFLHNTNFDFIGKRRIFMVISGILILAGLVSLIARGGPNYGIDFTGGILIQVAFDQPVNLDQVRAGLNASGFTSYELQSSENSIIVRAKQSTIDEQQFSAAVMNTLKQTFPDRQLTVERTEYVGPAVGQHLIKQAFFALIFSFIGIIVYVAFRFHSGVWGTAGVLGIMHDVFLVVGIFSILDKEITLTIIAALLTVAGYSINDTIVIFDRIRENLKLLVKEDFGSVINKSVNQTLSRTIITSLTVLLVSLSLYFFGGEVLRDFALALTVGVLVGSYSTIFVCTPLAYEWEQYKKRRGPQLASKSKYVR